MSCVGLPDPLDGDEIYSITSGPGLSHSVAHVHSVGLERAIHVNFHTNGVP